MYQHSNFYAVCIYLSKSSACMMVLLNMGLIITVLLAKALQAIFFGSLRAIEVEVSTTQIELAHIKTS
ncbi:Putative E3 ubiquitin-protein ligase synoviolin [Rhizopus microsporus]|nr:Putative E3 ubiquitin-protein ligase synoviolin [Rhizopus microsporus]